MVSINNDIYKRFNHNSIHAQGRLNSKKSGSKFETENKVAKDIHTEAEKKSEFSKKSKAIIAIASLAGALVPILAYKTIKGQAPKLSALKDMKLKDKTKEILEFVEIDGFKGILLAMTGANAAGLMAGLAMDKNPENKKAKAKESLFSFINVAIPSTLVASSLATFKKFNLNPLAGKAASVVLGIGVGVPLGAKISNNINKTFIDKQDAAPERKLKLMDYFVHIDDVVEMLVLAKVPFVKKLQVDKVLALIFAKLGYDIATTTNENQGKGHSHGH